MEFETGSLKLLAKSLSCADVITAGRNGSAAQHVIRNRCIVRERIGFKVVVVASSKSERLRQGTGW